MSRLAVFGLLSPAALALGVFCLAEPAAAQGGALCKQPRDFCGAPIAAACRSLVLSDKVESETDPACGGALKTFRACLREAANCPGVVDQVTPAQPKEANAACGKGDCAEEPVSPEIREPGETPVAPPDER